MELRWERASKGSTMSEAMMPLTRTILLFKVRRNLSNFWRYSVYRPMFDDHFVALMQIYIASNAIHQAKDTAFADAVRLEHEDINDRYNAAVLFGNDRAALDVYETELRTRLAGTKLLNAQMAWETTGRLGGLNAREVSARTRDDRVVRYCFAAQAIYSTVENDTDRDRIAMSVLRGRVTPDLRTELRSYVGEVVEGLRSCPGYEFSVYWGLKESLHLAHIVSTEHTDYSCRLFGHLRQSCKE